LLKFWKKFGLSKQKKFQTCSNLKIDWI
jgi:hypothetical protein